MKTMKIRIAVAVDKDGEWLAVGTSDHSDVAVKKHLENEIGKVPITWIEAEIPVPEEMVVQGKTVGV